VSLAERIGWPAFSRADLAGDARLRLRRDGPEDWIRPSTDDERDIVAGCSQPEVAVP